LSKDQIQEEKGPQKKSLNVMFEDLKELYGELGASPRDDGGEGSKEQENSIALHNQRN
jgi:hypothetical protein